MLVVCSIVLSYDNIYLSCCVRIENGVVYWGIMYIISGEARAPRPERSTDYPSGGARAKRGNSLMAQFFCGNKDPWSFFAEFSSETT